MKYEKQVHLLFQGDSITDCGRNRNDFLSLGGGYANHIAGQLGMEYAQQQPLILNRGISGNRVSDLYARWNEDAIYLQPRLLSLLIGVNDAWRIMSDIPEGAADRMESAYRHLLEVTKTYLPQTQLVLMEPFVLNCGATADNWEGWQAVIGRYQQVVRELAAEYGAVFVALQQPFDEACAKAPADYWLRDGVHPSAAGHALIAKEWLATVTASGWRIED